MGIEFMLVGEKPITVVSPLTSHVYEFKKGVALKPFNNSDENYLKSLDGLTHFDSSKNKGGGIPPKGKESKPSKKDKKKGKK